jgi:integrase/recombinase XerC
VTTAQDDAPSDAVSPAGIRLSEATDAFFVARRPRKDSPHTAKAYANDLRAIDELLARDADTPLDRLTVDDLTVPRLRSAFAEYADTHAKASINRCWSTWNQLFTFLVAEGHRDGNPMPAVAKAKQPGLHRRHCAGAARGGPRQPHLPDARASHRHAR